MSSFILIKRRNQGNTTKNGKLLQQQLNAEQKGETPDRLNENGKTVAGRCWDKALGNHKDNYRGVTDLSGLFEKRRFTKLVGGG